MTRPVLSWADLRAYDPQGGKGSGDVRFLCPLCGDSKPKDREHRSLSVNSKTGLWNCHRCGTGGCLKEHWEPLENRPSSPAKTRKPRRMQAWTPPPPPEPEPEPTLAESKAKEFSTLCSALKPIAEGDAAAEYLAGRGLPFWLIQAARLRQAAEFPGPERGGAIAFNLQGPDGKPRAVAYRLIGGRGFATWGPFEGKHGGCFMTPGAADARAVAIVEAPLDALSLALCGLPAVTIVGTGSPPSWLLTSFRGRAVLMAQDADESGDKAAARTTEKLATLSATARPRRLNPRELTGCKDWNDALQTLGTAELAARLSAWMAAHGLPLHVLKYDDFAALGLDPFA